MGAGGRPALAAWIALGLAACGGEPDAVVLPDYPPPRAPLAGVDARDVAFAIRGRWAEPMAISYRIEARGCPDALRASWPVVVERAAARWNATGLVRFVAAAAADGAESDVSLGWRRGHHGACEPFGASPATAHSGPVRPGTFVHFDADRSWSTADIQGDHPLAQTVLHEFGHVLGLGHSHAAGALMQPQAADGTDAITASEWAGLQSLYGGGEDQPGDLIVLGADGARQAALRQVAPVGHSGYAVADVDADGRAELVVWRTDREGAGAVMLYRFDDDCRLTRTTGPQLGAIAAGGEHAVVQHGSVWLMVSRFANGVVRVRAFDEYGMLRAASADAPVATASPHRGDLDGDGEAERVARVR